jgi:uncharacterized protein (DUF952 family)
MPLQTDLIFHVVSRRKWRDLNKGGFFQTEDFEDTGVINCVTSDKLNTYLNSDFKGRKNLLILVIDVFRLTNRYHFNNDNGLVEVSGGINTDAILDKIRIDCGEDGLFDIEVAKN